MAEKFSYSWELLSQNRKTSTQTFLPKARARYGFCGAFQPRTSTIVTAFGATGSAITSSPASAEEPSVTGSSELLRDVFTFNTETFDWAPVDCSASSYQPQGRAYARSAYIGEHSFMYFGGADANSFLDETLILQLDLKNQTGEWSKLGMPSAQYPIPRRGHAMATIDHRAYMYGGFDASSKLSDFWYFDPAKMKWIEVRARGVDPGPRAYHTLSNDGKNNLVVLGGSGERSSVSRIFSFDARAGQWNILPSRSLGRRKGHTAQVTEDGHLLLVGGVFEPDNNIVVVDLTTSPVQWRPASIEGTIVEHRSFAVTAPAGDGLFLVSGNTESSDSAESSHSVWKLQRVGPESLRGTERFRDQSKRKSRSHSPSPSSGSRERSKTDPIRLPGSMDNSRSPVHVGFSPPTQSFISKFFAQRTSLDKERKGDASDTSPLNSKEVSRRVSMSGYDTRSKSSQQDQPAIALAQRVVDTVFGTVHMNPPYPPPGSPPVPFPIPVANILRLCELCQRMFASERMVLKVKTPVKIFGDIHGQIHDLLEYFHLFGRPDLDADKNSYLFLGDYVDRGRYSLEVISLMFAYKLLYPNRVFIIRGNHEDIAINMIYGFYSECSSRLGREDGKKVFESFNSCFEWMPVAALVNGKIFCTHGGLGPAVRKLADVNGLKRPLKSTTEEGDVLLALTWADPEDPAASSADPAERPHQRGGKTVRFGPDMIRTFCKENKVSLVVRAHECVAGGFELYANARLVTIFSARNYCGEYENHGAMLHIRSDLAISFKVLRAKPKEVLSGYWGKESGRLPTPPRQRPGSGSSSSDFSPDDSPKGTLHEQSPSDNTGGVIEEIQGIGGGSFTHDFTLNDVLKEDAGADSPEHGPENDPLLDLS